MHLELLVVKEGVLVGDTQEKPREALEVLAGRVGLAEEPAEERPVRRNACRVEGQGVSTQSRGCSVQGLYISLALCPSISVSSTLRAGAGTPSTARCQALGLRGSALVWRMEGVVFRDALSLYPTSSPSGVSLYSLPEKAAQKDAIPHFLRR